MTHVWDYQGSYKGHVWKEPKDELSFAISDLEHAYAKMLDAPMTRAGIAEAKNDMDKAMDRMLRAIREAQRVMKP